MMVAAVILAGGRATRMGGGDKPLLRLHGQPILSHVIARVAPQVEALAISANGDPARFAAHGLPVLADPASGFSRSAGGNPSPGWIRAAGRGIDRLLSVPGDTPFLPRDLVARMQRAAFPMAASEGRAHPVVAIWPVALRDRLRQALIDGERRVGRFAAECGAERVDFTDAPDPFFNINTPEDLAAAAARLAP